MSARNWTLGLAVGVVLATGAPTALAAGPGGEPPATARTLRAPLPGGLGPCIPGKEPGEACPSSWPDPNNGDFTGRDQNINVFVGGDMLVRRGAAEAEGKVVVLGDFDMNKTAGVYNVGIAGVGSRVPPPNGSDFLTTGGDVTVATGQTLLADGGVVRYAGTLTGNVTGTRTHDANAADPYTRLRGALTTASTCYAFPAGVPRTATGRAVYSDQETVFTGDGRSPLQVFNVDFDLSGPSGRQQTLRFAGIPENATVLVNVTGESPALRVNNALLPAGLRERLLWNFPNAETATIAGSAQLGGSVLIGPQASVTDVSVIGMNGRFFTAGSVTHTSPTATTGLGAEFHAYPFNGDLPDCAPVPPARGSVSVLKHDENGRALSGAKFELWKETNGVDGLQATGSDPDTKVADCTTGTDGICAREEELGTYYWRETTPPTGYDLPAQPVHTLVLTAENATPGVRWTAVNTRTPVPPDESARVVLRKIDKDTGDPLPGARFELWRESNGTAGLQTGTNPDTLLGDGACVTDERGTCTVELPVGERYYWREVGLPTGYERPRDPVTAFDLDPGETEEYVIVTVPNRKAEEDPGGVIKVLKKDAKTKRPLRGAEFELWRETGRAVGLQRTGDDADERVGDECTTGRDGVCAFDGLPDGSYYVVEVDVPDGYVVPRDPVTGPLTLDGRTPGHRIAVTLLNKRVHDGQTCHCKDEPGHGKPDHGKPDHGKPEQGKPEHGRPDHEGPGHDGPGHGRPDHEGPGWNPGQWPLGGDRKA
ncbi:choice-of-anchor A family protein [Streptomyces sp. WAC07061]|uniref:choice-of-anchor A family protein n=1 Tax=Streptomyces sp. WAC07061 TaxID=2487410 RepID=UPI00163CE0A0|nr:choice-of-anchor A family protein [Streptomyces sp. WAC07061]